MLAVFEVNHRITSTTIAKSKAPRNASPFPAPLLLMSGRL
jgi:hypothetical protein